MMADVTKPLGETRSARIGLSVTPSMKRALEDRARAAGIPTSTLITMLLSEYLRNPKILPDL